MKKYLFILFLTLFSFNSIGQVWIDSGAVWHYDYWNIGYGGFYKYEYVQDTLIEGHNCQKITFEIYKFNLDQNGNVVLAGHYVVGNHYTYVSSDTVFYRHNGQFFVLYNFGASIGDNWVISTTNNSGLCADTSQIEVTDTGTVTINSIAYRFITVKPTANSAYGMKGTYVERFGNMDPTFAPFNLLFPSSMSCDPSIIVEWDFVKFKCFKDSSFALYNPSGEDCEYHLTHLGIHELNRNNFKYYPNPTSGIIYLDYPFIGEEFLEIYNYQGKLVRSMIMNYNIKSIDISSLHSGIYFLKFKSKLEGNLFFKVVKE